MNTTGRISSEVQDKVGKNVPQLADLKQQLFECISQIETVEKFTRELRLKDAQIALAIEHYYFTDEARSYEKTNEWLSRYLPRTKVYTASYLRRRMNKYIELL